MSNGSLTGIYIYPVKSCGSISVSEIHGNQSGLEGDRQWVFLGGGDNVLTQRDYASMALIQPTLLNENGCKLQLEAPNMPPIKVEHRENKDQFCEIDLWDNDRSGFDQGDEIAEWISEYLKTEARLLYTKVDHTQDARYVDCSPLLIISEESLNQLNTQVDEPVRMSRFRPSLVVKGLGEYVEDKAFALTIGHVELSAMKLCGRCVMINIDQEQGVLTGSEPLRTLSKYRKEGSKVMFGRYFECASDFNLKLDMPVSVEI
ncbi:MAG: MOSC domain-containing protein [Candidatus Melainabacteria bacterium]|nr:MAG: MOSC domain-containing protein [Candidatus Melainabacteria bacterium]